MKKSLNVKIALNKLVEKSVPKDSHLGRKTTSNKSTK